MDSQDVSAYAAYSKNKINKKKKANKSLGLHEKSKIKLKKKKKPPSSGSPHVVNSKTSEGTKPKNPERLVEKENIVETLLKAQIKSIFENDSSTQITKSNYLKQKDATTDVVRDTEMIKKSAQANQINKKRKLFNGELEENVGKLVNEEKELNGSNSKKKKNIENIDRTNSKMTNLIYGDSVKMGEEVFSWMISPMEVKDFFSDCWEIKPLHITRNKTNFFSRICTLDDFKMALKEKDMYFTKNIDVTSYVNGERFTEDLVGRATLPIVWDFFNTGHSIRLLNPQTFIPNIQLLITHLQEFFHCFVGANIYLTPAGTQGFAPHYDDIEAFVLQLDGEKQWKLYNPRVPEEVLPRESSQNFRQDEIGEPIMEVTLKPGDMLYFPRGIIHQAKCLPHVHSLHVTVSCYQKNTWADLFEKVFPVALERAIAEDVELRKGLPIGYLNHMGVMFSDKETEFRRQMVNKFNELANRIIRFCPLDAGIDQMAVDFVHSALPPCLAEEEKLYGADRSNRFQNKSFVDALKNPTNKNLGVKLIRATSVRLVSEDEEIYLYYTTDNSLVYRENEVTSISVPVKWTSAIEHLIRSYPNFVCMKSLPVMRRDEKPGKWRHIAEFVYFLWQRGLILFDKPHQAIYS